MVQLGVRTPETLPLTQPRRSRLRTRLLAWFLLFALAPSLATNAIGYVRTSAILRRIIEQDLFTIVQAEAQHVRDRLEQWTLRLEMMVAGSEFLGASALRAQGRPAGPMNPLASPAAIENLLQLKLAEVPEFEAIFLFTPDGQVVSAAGSADAVVTDAPSASPVLATVHRSRGVARPLLRVAVPVRAGDGIVVAFLGGTLSPNAMRGLVVLPPHLAGDLESVIVDEHGLPLFLAPAGPDPDSTAPYGHLPATPSEGVLEEYTDREGRRVVAAAAMIPGSQWRLISTLPTAQVFGDLQNLGRLSLALSLLLALLLVAGAWFVARDIVAPIRHLVDATQRVGRGDLSQRINIRQRGEVRQLGQAFNEMTVALGQANARAHELHHNQIERASQLATVGELASGVAHEIKNPVVGVAHGVDLIRRHVGPDPVLTPVMDEMALQLSHIQRRLQELLTFARLATPTLAPVSASNVAQRAIRLLQPMADRAGVRIEEWVDPALPRCDADEEMLYQALVNLFMNALQATPCGGRITVTTRATVEWVEIMIVDTGCGIPKDNLELVFKPFFTTRHTGTGLGLSLTREVAQRHGGRVAIESIVGLGTTVTLRLPRNRGQAEVAQGGGVGVSR